MSKKKVPEIVRLSGWLASFITLLLQFLKRLVGDDEDLINERLHQLVTDEGRLTMWRIAKDIVYPHPAIIYEEDGLVVVTIRPLLRIFDKNWVFNKEVLSYLCGLGLRPMENREFVSAINLHGATLRRFKGLFVALGEIKDNEVIAAPCNDGGIQIPNMYPAPAGWRGHCLFLAVRVAPELDS